MSKTHGLNTYLFVTDCELSLSLLIGICERLELLNGVGLDNFDTKLDVSFGVLVTRLN